MLPRPPVATPQERTSPRCAVLSLGEQPHRRAQCPTRHSTSAWIAPRPAAPHGNAPGPLALAPQSAVAGQLATGSGRKILHVIF